MPYATLVSLKAYLGDSVAITNDCTRQLARATEFIQQQTGGVVPIPTDPDAVPLWATDVTDTERRQVACRDAACAQVEYWLLNGEGVDTEPDVSSTTFGKTTQAFAGGTRQRLAPRAMRALDREGLLNVKVGVK